MGHNSEPHGEHYEYEQNGDESDYEHEGDDIQIEENGEHIREERERVMRKIIFTQVKVVYKAQGS